MEESNKKYIKYIKNVPCCHNIRITLFKFVLAFFSTEKISAKCLQISQKLELVLFKNFALIRYKNNEKRYGDY